MSISGAPIAGAAIAGELQRNVVASSLYASWFFWHGEVITGMYKNVAGQKITYLAIDTATNTPKTGDAANLTAYVKKDGGAVTVLADTSAAEDSSTNAPGQYTFDLAQAETNADWLEFTAKSSTSGVYLVPKTVYTLPGSFADVSIANNAVAANVTRILGTASAGAAGYVGIDQAQIANPGAVVDLSGTTFASSLSVGTVSGNVAGDLIGDVLGSVAGDLVGDVLGSVAGSVATCGEVNSLKASALAQFFTRDTTKTFGDAIAGSVVKEIADNAAETDLSTVLSDLTSILARLPAALTGAGNMKADMIALNGGAQSAADLKDFADDGYDPSTNKVQGVVLTDTATTVTNPVAATLTASQPNYAPAVAGNDMGLTSTALAAILTKQMVESYAAVGVAPTIAQALLMIQQTLQTFAISGVSNTVKKLDGSTTAAVMTLDSSTAPTSSTRTS